MTEQMIKQKNFVSAVVYVCDDQDTIQQFLTVLDGVLEENFEKFEIICVNDASRDRSGALIKSFHGHGVLRIVNMSFPQGLERAIHAGVDLAIGDFVFEFDRAALDCTADFIMQVYNRSLEGFDIVSCGRERMRFFSGLFYTIYNRSAKGQYPIRSETFRILSRRAINRIHSMNISVPYRKAIYNNCGLQTDFISYPAAGADQKQGVKTRTDTASTTLVMFTSLGYRLALLFSLGMMLATVATAIYIIVIYIMGIPVEGFTTMMLFVSFGFFMLSAIFAVVIKYLSILLELVFRRQKYVIESVEKVERK